MSSVKCRIAAAGQHPAPNSSLFKTARPFWTVHTGIALDLVVYDTETGAVDVIYPGNYSTRLSEEDPRICFRVPAKSSAQELMDAIYEATQLYGIS